MKSKNKHKKCIRWSYFALHVLLLILVVAFIATGARAIEAPFFHDDQFMEIETEYLTSIILFTFFYIGCFMLMLGILAKSFGKWNNTVVGVYAGAMFLFGFVFMAAEGSGLAALELVDIKDVYSWCQGNEESRWKFMKENSMSYIIIPFAEMAMRYDE